MSDLQRTKRYKAIYHQIVDESEWPIAHLLLILSPKGYPNRAEIFFNPDAPQFERAEFERADEAALIDITLNEARRIVKDQYRFVDADIQKLEVRILNVEQRSPSVYFDVDYHEEGVAQPAFRAWLLPAIVAAIMIIGGAYWGMSTLFSRTGLGNEVVVEAGAEADTEVMAAVVEDSAQTVVGSQVDEPVGQVASEQVAATTVETNGLPPSQNADNRLRVGQRVRVIPGSALTLRSLPGADAGEAVGFMQNAQEATIIGGPRWLQGISDTIVWWYVELDDGSQAWAPANDSQFTLLEPASRG